MKSNLFIPKKIKVGFQSRKDTFTGKLGFVIYQDEKNEWRQEKSWNNWRTSNLKEVELDNLPLSGFMLNRDIQRDNYHFGSGRSVIRVYHPEGFEFEIDCSNLLGILANCDISKRDILQKCVFAWSSGKLLLLPVNSVEYEESVKYTEKQSKKLDKEDLKEGLTYVRKKNAEPLIYIGYLSHCNIDNGSVACLYDIKFRKQKKHIFYSSAQKSYLTVGIENVAECIFEEVAENFHKLHENYINSLESASSLNFSMEDMPDISLSELKQKRSIKSIMLAKHIEANKYVVFNIEHLRYGNFNPAERMAMLRIYELKKNAFEMTDAYFQQENVKERNNIESMMSFMMQGNRNVEDFIKKTQEAESKIISKFDGWLEDFNFYIVSSDNENLNRLWQTLQKNEFKMLKATVIVNDKEKIFI